MPRFCESSNASDDLPAKPRVPVRSEVDRIPAFTAGTANFAVMATRPATGKRMERVGPMEDLVDVERGEVPTVPLPALRREQASQTRSRRPLSPWRRAESTAAHDSSATPSTAPDAFVGQRPVRS